jgi:hypothetical protein
VDDAFGNALVVEVGDLLSKVEVFHECWAALAGFERIVGVRNAHTLAAGQKLAVGTRLILVQLLLFA